MYMHPHRLEDHYVRNYTRVQQHARTNTHTRALNVCTLTCVQHRMRARHAYPTPRHADVGREDSDIKGARANVKANKWRENACVQKCAPFSPRLSRKNSSILQTHQQQHHVLLPRAAPLLLRCLHPELLLLTYFVCFVFTSSSTILETHDLAQGQMMHICLTNSKEKHTYTL